MNMVKFFFKMGFFFTIVKLSYSENDPFVLTSLGKIEGHYKNSPAGSKYEAYEGIPYAEPPVENNRFQPPKPVKAWTPNIIFANKIKEKCWTHSPFRKLVEGSENCLFLNIYVPVANLNQSLPVIIYIYGGAFQTSSLLDVEERNFMDKNVIFITFNYRHGVLGFLSTEDHVVSGNMGLKDQVMALKWVKDNIESFGGDAKRITVTGHSAGGASVHYHYLSPMSRGLFNNGISMSGTALMPWAQTENSKEKAIELGKLMNCTTAKIPEMIECLKLKPARSLTEAQRHFWGWRYEDFTPFGPVVEKYKTNAFIDRPPIEIINSGEAQNLPWITGVVREEGLYPIAEFLLREEVMNELDINWDLIAPHLLHFYYIVSKSDHAKVAHEIRKFYFGANPIDKNNLKSLINMVGDRIFGSDAEKSAKLHAKIYNSSVWYYYYKYRGQNSFSDMLSRSKRNFGVSHGDDVGLIFSNITSLTKDDAEMQRRLIDIWVSMAYSGQPNSELKWQQLNDTRTNFNYLDIFGPTDFETKIAHTLANSSFWDSLGLKENLV